MYVCILCYSYTVNETCLQKALQKTVFPIGHMTKSQVRKIAKEAGLHRTACRKEVIYYVYMYNICMYIHAYLRMYIHMYIRTNVRTYIHSYTHTCMHTYIHVCIYTYTRKHTLACTHIYLHLLHIRVWVFVSLVNVDSQSLLRR